ncbi:MAG: RluA family pseudouridine synthase [Proteobacteria bacterium]|nr:RluA family pseudouridine synthase [Pseudomonadota bacterium]
MQTHKLIADKADAGARLDAFVAAHVPGLTRSQAKRLIDEGLVEVGGNAAKPSHEVREGEEIEVSVPSPVEPSAIPQDIPLDIIFEDADIIVVNKPAGLVVHPAAGHPDGTLVNALLAHCSDLSGVGGELKAGIVHRLDVGTSGAIVAAKNDAAHVALQKQFQARTVEKIYCALALGAMNGDRGSFDSALGRHRTERKRISSHTRKGREALTEWRAMERFGTQLTWVEINLKTGRTHQIRAHFAEAGHALVGDPLYGGERKLMRIIDAKARGLVAALDRPALHSWKLAIDHPRTGERMQFVAPLPRDIKELLENLRKLYC